MTAPSDRSPIYYLLQNVEDSNEFIIMFAYAIYKREKMQEIERLTDKLQRPPTNEELQPFIDNATTRIDSFIKLAAIEMASFQETLLGNYINEISTEYAKNYSETVSKFQPQKPPSFMKSAVYGLAGNILTAIVSFILFVIALIAVKGFPGFWQSVLPFVTEWEQG